MWRFENYPLRFFENELNIARSLSATSRWLSARCSFEIHLTDKLKFQLPVWICDSCGGGNFVLPDEQSHDPVRLMRESSNMLIAPIPPNAERNGLFRTS